MPLLIPDRPWAMTETSYRQVLDILNRENLNLAEARAKQDDHTVRAVELYGGAKIDNARYMTLRQGVAIIDVYGPIARRANLFSAISGGTSIDLLARDVQLALDSPAVQSLLFVFDSPGGEVTGTSELAALLYASRGTKPMRGYIDGMACSAAYWLASALDSLTINDTALAGSIGVVMTMPDPTKSTAKDLEIVSSQSPNKRPDVSTEAGRSQIQALVDATADVFIGAVALHRGVTADTVVNDFGAGGVLVGQHAVAAGLVDSVGSFESTFAALRGASRLSPNPTRGVMTMTQEDKDLQTALIRETLAAQAPDPQIAALQKQLATMREQVITTQANAFVSAALSDHRILPAGAEHLTAAYTALAASDNPAALTALESFVAALPAHTLTTEQVPHGAVAAMANHTGAADAETKRKEETDEFLDASPLGRQAKAKEAK